MAKPPTPEQIESLKEMFENGTTLADMGFAMKKNGSIISGWLAELGLSLRDRQRKAQRNSKPIANGKRGARIAIEPPSTKVFVEPTTPHESINDRFKREERELSAKRCPSIESAKRG